MEKSKLSYAQKMEQTNKEALYTLILSLIIFVIFWISIFIFKDSNTSIMLMPAWFVISCIGGYILSVAGVAILIRYFMKNFSLDDNQEENDDQQ